MKLEDPQWRFVSPGPMPDGAVLYFLDLARKTAAQGRVQDILEDFKWRFADGTCARSSTADYAAYDLKAFMDSAAANAPLFIESFVNACSDILQQGYDVPSIDTINHALTIYNAWFQIDGDTIVRRSWIPPQDSADDDDTADSSFVITDDEQVVEQNPIKPSARPNQGTLQVFLCHSSGDKEAVRTLYARLRNDGFRPWLDEEDLLPGQHWATEIPKAVRASDVVIVCLSKSSVSKTGYVQKEITIALDAADERPQGAIYIIPALLEECTVPDRLNKWHWVMLYKPNGYERLITSLKHSLRGPNPST